MSSTGAVFVGEGTLLARCAQAWRDAGHRVDFIATRNHEVEAWAQANGIAHATALPEGAAFDYLFSVANLTVLPADVIGRARQLAINFHDGPLPKYAGLNAPVWALLNGEREHGITWHEMTERVDAGRIAKQAMFALRGDETALDLNARCYEAGLAAFAELAQDIARDQLQLAPQAGERTWFGRDRKPDALATIDFAKPASEIAPMVRALDHGAYANPVARPKVMLDGRVAFVRAARVADTASGLRPGTVVSAAADSITVATGSGDVVLSGIDAQVAAGDALPLIDDGLRGALNAFRPDAAQADVDAAAIAWVAATAAQENVTVGIPFDCPRALQPWFHPFAPLNVTIRPGDTPAQVKATVSAALAGLRGPVPRDIVLPDMQALPASVPDAWRVGFETHGGPLRDLPLAPPPADPARVAFDATSCVHNAIAGQAGRTPDRIALEFFGAKLTYAELDERSTAVARALVAQGVQPGGIVGLNLHRGLELVIAQLAIMKAGAAYLPLDPDYPAARLAFMVEDSGTQLVIDGPRFAQLAAAQAEGDLPPPDPQRAAYVIYTSGSTGKPKGVVVTHRNVLNFFAGMDERIAHDPPGRWLAVTSLSFDISVLETCWTLARGFTVVVHSSTVRAASKAPQFSLFYFASDHASSAQERYRLLMEGAKFADANGFAAVWTPERHFHAFGGLYPNPAVASAAIAACTSRIQIRAGSCVLPLHHPIRVAEEWSFVDNISQGRVGVSFASGWQPNDFVIAPQAFANRKNEMLANIDVVRRLWRGEKLPFPGPNGKDVEVQTLPRPIQQELPVWVTAAGNPETFEQAGTLGCHLLTHLLGQKIEDVAEKLKLYRAAWHKAGHAGQPQVTLMLHTFVGDDDDEVRETVRGPMKDYLRSSVDLIKQAAWSFPTFVQRAAQDGKNPVEVMEQAPLSESEMDALLEHAFNRYYGTSALFGTKERCLAMVAKLRDAGVDEIACLVDFGIPTQTVLDHLDHLKSLMEASRDMHPSTQRVSVAEQVLANGVTHLQCTPSMAAMLVADAPGRSALGQLKALMVGGEALPLKLARDLRALVPGQLLNMYGPTETTIWSTTCELREVGDFVPLGTPIANTQLRVRNAWGMDCAPMVPGELMIGGEGVTRGYWQRPELTQERFAGGWYRTGDLVRRHEDGRIEFLGRIDHQVKIRGHRIELGEIESALSQQPGVKQAVVIARDERLLGYVTGTTLDAEQLRSAVAKLLPEIMVPQAVLVLPALPLTPNGKTDRNALPEPNAVIAVRPAPSAPQGELEKTIAGIWQDVLGLPQVGTTDNFFDLGGHSLLVVQVQRRLREACGREVSITDMFRLPTIKALAAHLGGAQPQVNAVNDGLSRAQRRLERARRQWAT